MMSAEKSKLNFPQNLKDSTEGLESMCQKSFLKAMQIARQIFCKKVKKSMLRVKILLKYNDKVESRL